MSYHPDIWTRFADNCRAAGLQLTVFDGRTAKDFEGFTDGSYGQLFVAFDEAHAATSSDQEVLRKLTELVRAGAGRDTCLHLHYETWPQGVALNLADLKRALSDVAA
jgi:hypothetical protein